MRMLFILLLLLTGCTDKLYSMNKRINHQYKYIPDVPGHDFMKEPAEFEADGGGDCEDFANFKRSAALELGYKPSQIKFVHTLKEETTGQAHAVLMVDGYILNNMNDKLDSLSSMGIYARAVTDEQMAIITHKR